MMQGPVSRALKRLTTNEARFDELTCEIEIVTPHDQVRIGLLEGRLAPTHPDRPADLVLTSEISTIPVGAPGEDPWLAAASWRVATTDGVARCVPPVDLADLRWAQELPPLPGVCVSWSSTTPDTPFGALAVTFRVIDGRPVEVHPGAEEDVDAWFRVPARQGIASRAGWISTPESVSGGGDLGGDLDVILLIAGLVDTTPWVRARHLPHEQAAALDLFCQISESGLFAALSEFHTP